MPTWIDPARHAVLVRVVHTLDAAGVPYQATGGLAGNLWGSAWPLHDLDFDVPNGALERVRELFRDAEVAYGRLVDEEFDLELLQLRVGTVDVDVSGADDARVRGVDGAWRSLPSTIARAVPRPIGTLQVLTQPLEDLIAYKRALGRRQDVADLVRLIRSAP